MARLDDLFDIKSGLASGHVRLLPAKTVTAIPYLRPSKTQQGTISGWVEKASISASHRHPKHSIFVSTNGEGSHTYAYVSNFEFAANSDVSILTPKRDMSIQEKIFYAQAISLNRAKFSYGRKPKGERLKSIELPDNVSHWIKSSAEHDTSFTFAVMDSLSPTKRKNRIDQPEGSALKDLFDVQYGTSLELQNLTQNPNGINFIARTAQNNGVSAKVQRLYDLDPNQGMVLTVAGGGSVLETFLQVEPFYSGFHLFVLTPKVLMTADEMLYYATCIRANQYKYSYGRQANRTLKDLPLPAFDTIPDWVNGAIKRVAKDIKASIKNIS